MFEQRRISFLGKNYGRVKLYVVIVFLFVLLIGFVFLLVKVNQLEELLAQSHPPPNQNNPSFSVRDKDFNILIYDFLRRPSKASQVLKADKNLAIFFSPECPTCLEDAPIWNTIYEKCKTSGVHVVGFSVTKDTTMSATTKFVDYNQIKFPVFIMPVSELHRRFGRFLVPQVLLINANEGVERTWYGRLSGSNFNDLQKYLKLSFD